MCSAAQIASLRRRRTLNLATPARIHKNWGATAHVASGHRRRNYQNSAVRLPLTVTPDRCIAYTAYDAHPPDIVRSRIFCLLLRIFDLWLCIFFPLLRISLWYMVTYPWSLVTYLLSMATYLWSQQKSNTHICLREKKNDRPFFFLLNVDSRWIVIICLNLYLI